MADPAPPQDAPEAAEQRGEPAPPATPQASSRGPWPVLLVLIVALAAAGYYWTAYVHREQAAALARDIAAADRALVELGARLEANGAELGAKVAGVEGLVSDLEGTVGDLEAAHGDLETSVKTLYARESKASLDWVLSETEYLVMAATQRLALERDVATAIAALEAADKVLRAAQHPELIALRERLASDIAALEAVARPDVEGLAIWLAEAVTRVERLPTRPIADLDMSFPRMSESEVDSGGWRELAQALWADLRSLVEIKDGELEDGVLFDPELRYFLQQNLRLELASARLAVLRRDTANFRAACQLVGELLATYYDTDDAAVRALRERLATVSTLELDPDTPGIAGTLDAVRARRDELREAALAGP